MSDPTMDSDGPPWTDEKIERERERQHELWKTAHNPDGPGPSSAREALPFVPDPWTLAASDALADVQRRVAQLRSQLADRRDTYLVDDSLRKSEEMMRMAHDQLAGLVGAQLFAHHGWGE